MAAINPYLHFNGNAEEAFTFYRSVFGGEFTSLARFKDVPSGTAAPEGDSNNILHVSLPIGKETNLLGSDVPASFPPVTIGSNSWISINTESEEEASKLFNALSAGGKIKMPLDKTFWGAFFGMLTDRFGIQWMVNYNYNKM